MTIRDLQNLVSVIVPAYNYAHFLPEALKSILHQSYDNWECIIVDDGSTDNTQDVLAEFLNVDRRFKYIYQENKGLPAARNRGIKEAQGQFFQFLDADDLIESNKLERHATFLKEHAKVDIVYGEARYFATERPHERLFNIYGENKPWMPKVSGSGKEVLKALLAINIMVVSSPLVRKTVFRSCGLFDESLKSHEDWELWLRCAMKGKYFQFLEAENTLTLIRYHQLSMSKNRITMFETNLSIREKISAQLKDRELLKINRKHSQGIGFELSMALIKDNKKMKSLYQLLKFCLNIDNFNKFIYGLKVIIFGYKSID